MKMKYLKLFFMICALIMLACPQADAKTKHKKSKSKTKISKSKSGTTDEKLKACAEILKTSFPMHLENEKVNSKLDEVMGNRLDIAFSRTALAYLKLQAERDKGRKYEADNMGKNVRTMPEADRALAENLYNLLEKDPPEENIEKMKEYLGQLLTYSKKLNLKSAQIMDESDVSIMGGFLAGKTEMDSTESYGKIVREMRDLVFYKNGQPSKDMTPIVAKKLDSYQKARSKYVSSAQKIVLSEIKNLSELSSSCKTILSKIITNRQTDKLTALDQNCSLYTFLNSAFPNKKLIGFAKMNNSTIDFLLDHGVDQEDPDSLFDAIKRGNLICNYTKAGDNYKFDLVLQAPRKTFSGWNFQDSSGKLIPLTAPEQKFVQVKTRVSKKSKKSKKSAKYKTVSVAAKETSIGFVIPSFEIPESDIKKKLKIMSPDKKEYEGIDLMRSCKITQADPPPPPPAASPTQGLKLNTDGCALTVESLEMIKIGQITVIGDPSVVGSSVKIGNKTTTLQSKGDFIGVFDLDYGPAPLPEIMTINTAKGEVLLSLNDCKSYPSLKEQIEKLTNDKEKDDKDKDADKEKKEAEIRRACGGGEGKFLNRRGFKFIACRDGVSDSERQMIKQFCDGQAGSYDVGADKVTCNAYNSQAPAPISIPTLPMSIINGVTGLNMKGFY